MNQLIVLSAIVLLPLIPAFILFKTLPSRAVVETLPLSVLEAMACEVPVIASRVGSVEDVVRDGETGRLVEPGDAESLAQAIAMALDDPVTTRRMAQTARHRVETEYSIDRTARQYEQLFEEIMIA